MTIIYSGHTQILANSDLDALGASVAAVQPATYNASMAEFNVRDTTFGALGNGAHDDTSAFAAALAAAGASGGVVRVPKGTYKITAGLTMLSHVYIKGDGSGVSVISAPAMGGLVLFTGASVSDVSVDGLGFTGVYAKAVQISDSSFASVTNCAISGATSPQISDGYAAGVHCYRCTDVTISGNVCTGNGVRSNIYLTYDIMCNGLGSYGYPRWFIRNNRCLSTDVHGNIAGYNLQESEITGNECSGAFTRPADNSGYGLFIYLATSSTQWSAAVNYVVGDLVYLGPTGGNGDHYQCVLNHINHTPPNATYWTLLDHGLRDNIISGNNVHDTEGLGIYVAQGRNTLVTNNQIRNVCTVMTEATLPASGIGINGGSATISHNRVDTSGRSGICINTNNFPCVIANNVVRNAAGLSGILLRGDTSNIRVDTNDVSGSAGGGIGSSNVTWLMTNISVIGNNITSSTNSGIFLSVPTNCTVSKNTITLTGTIGLWLYPGGTNNAVTGNVVIDSSQTTPNTYSNIVISSPQTTVTGNITGNSLANGSKYGVSVDAAGAVGSSITGNVGKDNRTLDFSLATGTASGGNVSTGAIGAFTLGQLAQMTGQGPDGLQLVFGESSTCSTVGTVGSSGDIFTATNAKHGLGATLLTWHQTNAAVRSVLLLQKSAAGANLLEGYVALPGTADAIFATFWGATPAWHIDAQGYFYISGVRVVRDRGAAVADVASANATDLASVILVANECKQELNLLLARLRAPTGHGLIA